MVNIFRFSLAIFVIVIIVLQNSTENLLLRGVNKKSFNWLIWILITFFLIITFFTELLRKEFLNF